MSDEELLKFSYRNPYRFGELFDRHQKRFLRVARRTLRSDDDAEDVVQEVFIKIYKYGKKFSSDNRSRFVPWANVILKNCLADQINKYKNIPVALTEKMEDTTSSGEEEDVFADKNCVQFILNKIGGAAAEVLKLRYILGKSFKEIAKILKTKNSTARVRVHRSKKIFMEVYRQFNNQL